MLQSCVIIPVALAYIGILFAIARYGDKRADEGRSIIANPYIYCAVARRLRDGVDVLRQRGPRRGRRRRLPADLHRPDADDGAVVARDAQDHAHQQGEPHHLARRLRLVALRQERAHRRARHDHRGDRRRPVHRAAAQGRLAQLHDPRSSTRMSRCRRCATPRRSAPTPRSGWRSLLAIFTILFGTRHLDASERHEGLVAAIAFESLVKLVAFLAVGVFVTWGIYDGLADIFARAGAHPRLATLFAPLGAAAGSYASWAWLTVLSMLAIMFLPRQFQIAVVENVNENHLGKAIWLFPLYMLAMNLFVVPVAFGGVLHFSATTVDPDTFVLTLPMAREAGGARAARVHRRAVGGDRHGDRRDHRAVDDGVQRPRDAGAAADAVDAARRAPEPRRDCCSASAAARSSRSCCSAISISASPARPTRWSRSASSRSPRSRSSRRRPSAASTGKGRRAPGRLPGSCAGFASGSTRCSCRRSRSRAGCRRASSTMGRSASRC